MTASNSKKTRNRKVGKLTEAARQRLWNAVRQQMTANVREELYKNSASDRDRYPDGEVKPQEVYWFVEDSDLKGSGVSQDLISDFLSSSPSQDREFSKAKILFGCFGLNLTAEPVDWIPKTPTQAAPSARSPESNGLPSATAIAQPPLNEIEPSPTSTPIDWLAKCRELLIDHKENLATNVLQDTLCRNFDNIYVPLGLVKREEKQRPTLDRQLDPAADRGSELYQEQTTPISHAAFLETVRKRQSSERHIAILGEPGAGKTTLLTRVWESLLDNLDANTPQIVAWVPLARLQTGDLEDYLQHVWLRQICNKSAIPTYWESFLELAAAGKVWLLLDGADEMGGDGLSAIATTLGQHWTQQLRAVVTCRLNLWDTGNNKLRSSFQIFRTLEFRYSDPDRPERDEVAEFIHNWFGTADPSVGLALRAALEETGKERIKDLARNPLRLTLLCNIWQRGQRLPDTQAGLYRAFVNYFYQWKATPEIGGLRTDLDRVMGELAKYGLNKPALRFRFTATELRDRVGLEYLKVLKASGWLNCVGVEREQPTAEIYAFFHPTFQEYFAACRIEDWDYFLPKSHRDKPMACEGEAVPTYRVFEAQWRQVILLWMGREDRDIAAQKEEFIEKLMNFDDGVRNEFYYCRAYFLAANCVGEFKDSCWAEEIVEQIVKWAFDYFNPEKQEWSFYPDLIKSLAREIIPFTHRRKAIDTLVSLMADPDRGYLLRQDATKALGHIAVNDQEAIDASIALARDTHLIDDRREDAVGVLGKIAVGNQEAIAALIALVWDYDLRQDVAWALGHIAAGNQEAIAALIALVPDPQRPFYLMSNWSVVWALGELAVGNREAIDALVALMQNPLLGDDLRSSLVGALSKIAVNDRETIDALVALMRDSQLDDDLCSRAAGVLSKIAVNDREAIDALMALMRDPQLDNRLRYHAADALGKIAIGNPEAIAALITLARDLVLDYELCIDKVKALSKIVVNDRETIDALVALLIRDPLLGDKLCFRAAVVLGDIAVNDREAIDALMALVQDIQRDEWLRQRAAYALGDIAICNPEAIADLVSLVRGPKLDYALNSVAYALGKIAVGNREAIADLVALVQDTQLDDLQFNNVYLALKALGKIAVNDRETIDALVALMQDTQLDDELRSQITFALGDIAIGNPEAIADLVSLVHYPDLDYESRSIAVDALWDVAIDDRKAMIDALPPFVDPRLNDHRRSFVIFAVRNAIGNRKAIDALVALIGDPQPDNWGGDYVNYDHVTEILIKLITPEIMPSAIWQLKNCVTDKVYNSDFKYCYKFLFHCAQTLTYPDFYTAWHPPLPSIPFTPTTLHHQLNRPHTAILDLSDIDTIPPTADISIHLSNRIYLELGIRPIPPDIDSIPKLQRELLNLNFDPHLVLICYHPQRTPNLVRAIDRLQLAQRIQRIWLTDDAIEGALPPAQEGLVAAIWGAIDRFSEIS